MDVKELKSEMKEMKKNSDEKFDNMKNEMNEMKKDSDEKFDNLDKKLDMILELVKQK